MNNRNFELPEELKLSSTNYLQWKPRMKNLLTLFGYYHLITRTETEEESTISDKLDPRQKEKALAILCLNCNVKVADQFILESNDNPSAFWEIVDKSFSLKSVQNQTKYLNEIFSFDLTSGQIDKNIKEIMSITRNLCSLIDDNKTKPSLLIDSMIAMWFIINLPPHLKLIGEILLQNFNGNTNPPSLKHLWEEFRLYSKRQNHKNSSALVSIQGNPTASQPNLPVQQNSHSNHPSNSFNSNFPRQNQLKNFPQCAPGWHNPLTKHKEEDCSFLKPKGAKPIVALNTQTKLNKSQAVILDSGATDSMFNHMAYFTEFKDSTRAILLVNGSQITAKGIGTVKIELPHSYLEIKETLYCPDLSNCLLSMGSLLKNHYVLQPLNGNSFKITNRSNRTILEGDYSSGALIVKQFQSSSTSYVNTTPNKLVTLHRSSGHPSFDYFMKMYPHLNVQPFSCLTCDLCKMTKKPFSGHFPPATAKGETLHLDLCGPITLPSESGAKYFLRIVDSFSRYVWVVFLQQKSKAKEKIKNLILKIHQTPLSKVSNVVSDNGSEFKKQDLLTFFQKEGITHLTTSPYTPEQNPVAERGNRTTMNKARCLLKDSGLPLSYWAEAVNTAVYLENLTPNSSIDFEKPFRKWHCREPSLKYLHPFGCLGIYYNNYINGKFSDRGVKGVFLGYGEGHRSFRILDVEKEVIPTDISTTPMTNLPKHKGYTWVPETTNLNQNEIISDIDPRNILNESRRKIHSINSVSTLNSDPKNYIQALQSPEKDFWIDAIRNELDNMTKHQVWTPSNHPPNLKPLTTTWVFKKKTNENGNLTKFKARLCVRGFSQTEGIDYDEVFSPTGRLASL
ncbi:hypothetical protein O181_095069 [Austropuccinia psidii MF-1]|uniref:Integrase catalytic domain-containing protein n=1 Tax=Austropuccinia psidii MF-1 TaxID=1389203 RepID=A0A9Q3J4L4_9BASI|nr:hypothetical protein [Austropuccinia psidii MF-1]